MTEPVDKKKRATYQGLSIWWSDVPLSAKEPAADYGTAL